MAGGEEGPQAPHSLSLGPPPEHPWVNIMACYQKYVLQQQRQLPMFIKPGPAQWGAPGPWGITAGPQGLFRRRTPNALLENSVLLLSFTEL